MIFTEDALSAKGPYLKQIQEMGAHFIVSVNPTGNPSLFAWLKGTRLQKKVITKGTENIELTFYNGVPINDLHHDLQVNFIDCIVKNKKGKIRSHFSWITDILATEGNVYELSRGGRARWKIENETFNTLKNQSYQFEHNFGHGYKHLSHVFGLLMFLACRPSAAEMLRIISSSADKDEKKALFLGPIAGRISGILHRVVVRSIYVDSWKKRD